MSLPQGLLKSLRQIKNSPKNIRHFLHERFPESFGQEIQSELVQFYRHDEAFTTALSFNHFIEFFTNRDHVEIKVSVTLWDHNGKRLGFESIDLKKRGAFQIFLKDLFPQIDPFGMFAVRMEISPRYHEEIGYLGALSPQFMTLFVPTQSPSASQMIHSHKKKQGFLLLPRHHVRPSSYTENFESLSELQVFLINSSASALKAQILLRDLKSGLPVRTYHLELASYGAAKQVILPREIPVKEVGFEYHFNRSVDHKKPIIFRKFKNGSLSCNHT